MQPERRGRRGTRNGGLAFQRGSQASRARGDAVDPIEVRTGDGVALRGEVREPPARERVGVAVLAHAMMARRSEFERPQGGGLARFLVSRGWRTIAFDFRGHGESGEPAASGGSWTYDDLVRRDLPAVYAAARARARKLPVVIVGHSLGGHVALAAQGTKRIDADAIVGIASNVWLRDLEPSRARWLLKLAAMAMVGAAYEKRGYFPARVLRMGSDDEAAAYFAALRRTVATGRWTSDDGVDDYLASLAKITAPVMSLTSDGDRLNCHPDCATLFHARCGGVRANERVRRADDGGRPPGHMELVTTERAKSAWTRVEAWMRQVTR